MSKKKTFQNGFKFVHATSESSIPISCIYLVINFGSIHLPTHLLGASHFIEHMCFKGTTTSTVNIPARYERMGAFFNAYSTERCTYFVLKCNDNNVMEALSLLAEQLFLSSFDVNEMKTEREVVINENRNYEDDPSHMLDLKTQSIIYQDTPFELPVDSLEYHKKGKGWTRKTVYDLYKKYYQPFHMMCSVSSKLPFSKWIGMLEKTLFCKQATNKVVGETDFKTMFPLFIRQQIHRGPLFSVITLPHKNEMETALFNISFKTCSQYEFKDKYKLHFLSHILGNTQISRLFKLLRVEIMDWSIM